MQDALAAGSPQHSLEPARALQRAQKHGQIGWQGDFARGEEGAQHERHTSWFRPRTGTGRGRGCLRSNPIDSFVYKIRLGVLRELPIGGQNADLGGVSVTSFGEGVHHVAPAFPENS